MHHFCFWPFPWSEEHQNTCDQHMSFLCAREVFRKVKRKSLEGVGPLDQDHKGLAAVGLGDSMVFLNAFIVPH